MPIGDIIIFILMVITILIIGVLTFILIKIIDRIVMKIYNKVKSHRKLKKFKQRILETQEELDKDSLDALEYSLLYYESELLYILVDHFKKPYEPDFSKYKFYDLRRFPRKKFHMVLMDHPIVRNRLSPSMKTMGLLQPSNTASASFTSLIKRLEKKGWIKRIKDGKKLYLMLL